MKLEEFANRLNGRQYLSELEDEDIRIAKENGFLIIYGYSDDNVEVDGVFKEEFPAYDGTTIYYCPKTKTVQDTEPCCEKDIAIECLWCSVESDFTWSFKTDVRYEPFEIYDGEEYFCLGIVIDTKTI